MYHDLILIYEYCSLQLVHLNELKAAGNIHADFQGDDFMKFAAIALAVTALAAGSASAAEKVSDVDFLKANRCKGLATSIDGVVDPASLDSFIKAERGARNPYIIERAGEEFQRAKKEAKAADRKERLTAELTGGCQAYLGGGTSMAKQATGAAASDVSKQ